MNSSHLYLITAASFFFLSFPTLTQSQNKTIACPDVKNGVFNSYPKNTADHFLIYRDGDSQKEINLSTGDSVLWKVDWVKECSYNLKYISGSGKLSAETAVFLRKHKLAYEIQNVTEDYYTFKASIDKTSNTFIQADTMWLWEKAKVADNELYQNIRNEATLKKSHFSDTSKYAVMYIYRPGKVTNSWGNFLVYFDDNILCVAKNKTGYIFKILKEGRFQLKSKLYKDESSVLLDVKFGNKYYVKSMIHWGISSRLYNFKLEMAIVRPEQGKIEFEEVNKE